MKFVKVAIDCPVHKLFDYRVPDPLLPSLLIGRRVLVPFRRRQTAGVILGQSDESTVDPGKLKPIESLLDQGPVMDEETMQLALWAARYYLHPIGQVVFNALPPILRKPKSVTPRRQTRYWIAGPDPGSSLQRAPKQEAIFQWLRNRDRATSETEILNKFGHSRPVLNALINKKLLLAAAPAEATPRAPDQVHQGGKVVLNTEQNSAFESISQHLSGYHCTLLDGVTGSGKTEVYIEAIRAILQNNKQALFLVPEIGLTPQLQQRLHNAIGAGVGMLHSGLTAADRMDTWQRAANGTLRILLGTRSAVFTPMPQLGLIIVDEEHDSSFKQQEGFLYHARDVAIFRAHRRNIPVILGSATPSFESLHNVELSRYQHLRLTQRAGDARLPQITMVDLRAVPVVDGLSQQAIHAMHRHLAGDRQVMLFLNRRGYAPTLLCTHCGWLAECTRCDARMTVHKTKHQLVCHHCERRIPLPAECPACHQRELLHIGEGTQRIEEVLHEYFPNIPVTRLDRDSTRKRHTLSEALATIQDGHKRIIIGTQMIAKGHDFPNVSLVIVVNLDYGFFSSDFRALERTSQMLIQVAGRAGRRNDPGEVLVQSNFPEHPYMQTLLQQGYHAFAQLALQKRKAASLPPYIFHTALRAQAKDVQQTYAFLQAARRLSVEMNPDVKALGPIPSSMERKAGYSRAYILFEARNRAVFKQHFIPLMEKLGSLTLSKKVQWAVDVDPLDSE